MLVLNVSLIELWQIRSAGSFMYWKNINLCASGQVTSPVQWEKTLGKLLEKGLVSSYELGPGKVIAGIMKRVDKKQKVINITV